MSLTHDDVLKILKIIDESPFDTVRLEIGDLKVHVSRSSSDASPSAPEAPRPAPKAAPTPQPAAAPAAAVAAAPKAPAPFTLGPGQHAVHSPMVGTFYRAPSPGEKPFVEEGQKVGADETVCLVEVMKLFNSIKAGVTGKVVKILVENGKLVEHGQPLIVIEEGP